VGPGEIQPKGFILMIVLHMRLDQMNTRKAKARVLLASYVGKSTPD
jgi:hypothetical protein